MKVFNEIERKFLLRRLPRFESVDITYKIDQWYASDGFRYRYQTDESGNNVTIFKTRKTNLSKGVNREEETLITKDEFNNIDLSKVPHVSKKRYVVSYKGKKFEIDRYYESHLILLEVELENLNDEFDFPPYIEKEILMEVTGNEKFNSFNLTI